LARVSSASSVAVSSHKIHELSGISPRYAAPEMFARARTALFSDHAVSFHFFIISDFS